MFEVIKKQILEIRKTGLANMLDVVMVLRLAKSHGYKELMEFIASDDGETYFAFIIRGE